MVFCVNCNWGTAQKLDRLDTVASHPQFWGLAFPGSVGGEQLLAALVSTVDWVVWGTYRTAWAVAPRCLCSYAYGRRLAVGSHTGGTLLGATPWFVEGLRTSIGTLVCRWRDADMCEPELLRWFGVVCSLAQR